MLEARSCKLEVISVCKLHAPLLPEILLVDPVSVEASWRRQATRLVAEVASGFLNWPSNHSRKKRSTEQVKGLRHTCRQSLQPSIGSTNLQRDTANASPLHS